MHVTCTVFFALHINLFKAKHMSTFKIAMYQRYLVKVVLNGDWALLYYWYQKRQDLFVCGSSLF